LVAAPDGMREAIFSAFTVAAAEGPPTLDARIPVAHYVGSVFEKDGHILTPDEVTGQIAVSGEHGDRRFR
jgi:hypothetical protein